MDCFIVLLFDYLAQLQRVSETPSKLYSYSLQWINNSSNSILMPNFCNELPFLWLSDLLQTVINPRWIKWKTVAEQKRAVCTENIDVFGRGKQEGEVIICKYKFSTGTCVTPCFSQVSPEDSIVYCQVLSVHKSETCLIGSRALTGNFHIYIVEHR